MRRDPQERAAGRPGMHLAGVLAAWCAVCPAKMPGQAAGIPPTAPTSVVGVAATSPSQSGAASVRHRASVVVDHDRLEIRAENSSLNAILREVAARSGMTVTGGVMDQRVFGTYGPGPASEVLSELLQDTGTNMILRLTATGGLGELTLSPRMGGPTPPSPNSFRDEEDAASSRPQAIPSNPTPAAALPQPPRLPFSGSINSSAGSDPMRAPVTPDAGGFVSVPIAAPTSGTGTTGPPTPPPGATDQTPGATNGSGAAQPQSPNGVRTPQQIYEELQKLLQQQQKAPGNP